MIPLRVDTLRNHPALFNALLIIINILAFVYELSLSPHSGQALVYTFGLVPANAKLFLTGHSVGIAQAFLPMFTSMFLHAGWLHLLGNMLFLFVFGGSVEEELGHFAYLIFYLICGIGAAFAHTLFSWGSTVPTVGASGAISGVMGAYIVFFPRSRVTTLIPALFLFFTIRIPAVLMLGYWFFIQIFSGVMSLGTANQGGVAWFAHIGGFVLGAVFALGRRFR
jgi:membrane associated rhomboid family serine protease